MRVFLTILVFILFENLVIGQENEKTNNKPPFENISNEESRLPRFRLSLAGGFSYTLINPFKEYSEPFASHFSNIRKGLNYEGDGTFYFAENVGIGFKFASFQSKSNLKNVDLSEGVKYTNLGLGTLSGNNNVNFLAPFISLRLPMQSTKNNLILNIGLGRAKYRSRLHMLVNEEVIRKQYIIGQIPQKGDLAYEEKGDINSTSTGYTASAIFERTLNKHFTIGFSANVFRSIIKKFSAENMTIYVKESGLSEIQKSEGHYVYEKGKFHNISRIETNIKMAFMF